MIFFRRLIVIFLAGFTGAIAVGVLAPNATTLIFGILALGLSMVLAILFYLLKPLSGVQETLLPSWPTPTLSSAQPRGFEQINAEIIQIVDWRKRKDGGSKDRLQERP